MLVRMLYFAAARERVGQTEETLELEAGTTVAGLLDHLERRAPELGRLRRHLRVAVNEAFVRDLARVVEDGDVVALIPPVAGGAGDPRVAVTDAPLDAARVEALVRGPDRGGVVTFTGTVRDHTGEHRVVRLEYEAYASMAEAVLTSICAEAADRWPGVRVAVHHRVGVLEIGDAAVVVATSAPHRAEALAACAHVIDRLKEDAPIFKKEVRADGSIWVGLGP